MTYNDYLWEYVYNLQKCVIKIRDENTIQKYVTKIQSKIWRRKIVHGFIFSCFYSVVDFSSKLVFACVHIQYIEEEQLCIFSKDLCPFRNH